jgi:poly(hydroxyalkanoate) depolymerase family esterase
MLDMKRTMQEAMAHIRSGDLHAATRTITRGLAPGNPAKEREPRDECITTSYRVVEEAANDAVGPGAPPASADAPPREGEFIEARYTCDAGDLRYKLFVPAGLDAAPVAPLLVMLHGCTQSPDDFARGTRMNILAQQHGYVVAYPAQSHKNNAGRCWNWFRSGDQQRGRGEPALLAALTSHLVDRHGLDAQRVYVAGLSAGGAMAAVLGHTYPDLYAAIGVHSGLPHLAAHDLPSALAAMRGGNAGGNGRPPAPTTRVPAIVFHGDRDTTVDPGNGDAVLAQSVGAQGTASAAGETTVTVLRGSTAAGRAYTRTIHTDGGVVVAEHWLVHDAGHAWFGGDRSGSYTDAAGPDASAEMLRFFAEHARDGAP